MAPPKGPSRENQLYYGDNLDVLRQNIADESVDLVYLDPPFNSNRAYSVLFKKSGDASQAQLEAFDDTWTWSHDVEAQYLDLLNGPPRTRSRMPWRRCVVSSGTTMCSHIW